ncbi:MAG: asparagine synthetase B [Candidatus Zixiibacteriota bacterium]
MRRKRKILLLFILIAGIVLGDRLLIPMDLSQTDHLKAYGIAYWGLEQGFDVEWLLNYRSGSFMMPYSSSAKDICNVRGVTYETISESDAQRIYATIEENNMEVVLLEKAPKVAVYVPPTRDPWDDAVRMALEYAEIPHETLWDPEVLMGQLDEYDWLHLHHEDFTGQYGKFYASYRNAIWYKKMVSLSEKTAREMGYKNVPNLKKAVVLKIRDYMSSGGFVFAMCSATDTYDIALAALETDICDVPFDGTPVEPGFQDKLNYDNCLAFENFQLITDPMVYEHSNIDVKPSRADVRKADGNNDKYFRLFDFSAKYDPVPTMLTQDHTGLVPDFLGQNTAFKKDFIKDHVIILAEYEGANAAKYIHGNFGRGTFTFLGGHDPEDYAHYIGERPPDLALYKNSPGYRLILNNVLFPAAKKKKQKT